MAPTFLRRTSSRYSKLGRGRKKKQVWRRPTGRDNKMRERRKGYPAVVSVGYRTNKKEHKNILVVNNLKDLENMEKSDVVVFGNIGKKKKIEFAKKAKEMKIEISNLNIEKFLKEIEKKDKKKKAEADKLKAETKTKGKKVVAPKGVPRETSEEVSTKGKKKEEVKKELNAAPQERVSSSEDKENKK